MRGAVVGAEAILVDGIERIDDVGRATELEQAGGVADALGLAFVLGRPFAPPAERRDGRLPVAEQSRTTGPAGTRRHTR
jgi:hypothetical protein